MGKAKDEAGNIWETDAQGNPVRLLQPGGAAMGPSIGNDPRMPFQLQQAQGQAAAAPYAGPKAAAELSGQGLSNQRTAQDIALDKQKFAVQVKDQYDKDQRVRQYREVLPSVVAGMSADRGKQGDLTVVYAWAKAMDPMGSVREGDTALAQSSSSYVQQALQYVAAINKGKGLAPEVRDGLINEMRNKARQLRVQYDDARTQYTGLAKQSGLEADLVIGPRDGDKYREIEKAFREQHGLPHERVKQGGNVSGANIVNEFNPEQTAFVDTMIRQGIPHDQAVEAARGKYGDAFASTLAAQAGQYRAASDYAKRHPSVPGSLANVTNQRETSPFEQFNAKAVEAMGSAAPAAAGFGKGLAHTWDRAAGALAAPFGGNPGSAEAAFAGQPVDPTTELFGKIAGAGTLAAPIANPWMAGAAGNLLAGNSTGSDMIGEGAIGAVGGKAGDMLLRGASGLIAPKTDPAALRLHGEGVKLTPGRMIPGMSIFEDLAESYPLIAGKISAGKALTKETLNRVPANRSLAPIGQTLPDNVPAGHDAVAYTQRALSDHYDNALAGKSIMLDPTYVTRLNTIGARSGLRPQEFNEFADLVQREVGGAFTNGKGVMSGRDFKRLDEKLGKMSSKLKRSDDPYRSQLGEELDKVIEQTKALARRQSPDMASSLRAADQGWANFVPYRSAAAANPADGLATPGQFRTAIRQSDRSVGRGATARGEALMQDFASDASKIIPEARANSGTTDRANLASLKAWALGALTKPLYSEPVTDSLQYILMRQPGPTAQAIGGGLDRLPRGMFGASLPWLMQPGQ